MASDSAHADRSKRDRWCRVCKTVTNHVTVECSRYDAANPDHAIPGCLGGRT